MRGADAGNNTSESEIDNLCDVCSGDDDIRGLDVTVHDVVSVSCGKSSGDLDREVERFADWNHSARNFMREGLAIVVLHHDEKLAVFGLFESMDDAYIGMIESGCGACFAKEVSFVFVADSNSFGQEFQSDGTFELGVERLIDDTHTASAQFLGDAVMRDRLIDHGTRPEVTWILGFPAS